MKISVVIPTYNRAELLYRVLYRLHCQGDTNYEVLVSNDDDADRYKETEEVCLDFQSQGMPLQHFYTGQYKKGATSAVGQGWSLETYPMNVGIRKATGDLLLLNSGDVMSATNTLDQHRQWHLTHANTVLVSTVHALTTETQLAIESYPWKENPRTMLFKGSCCNMFTGIGTCYMPEHDYAEATNPFHFLMSLSRQVFVDIGACDEDYCGVMACGDVDIADRLVRHGLTFHYSPYILAIHQAHKDKYSISNNKNVGGNQDSNAGAALFEEKKKMPVIRNIGKEWGQYPRDMATLPQMSGVLS